MISIKTFNSLLFDFYFYLLFYGYYLCTFMLSLVPYLLHHCGFCRTESSLQSSWHLSLLSLFCGAAVEDLWGRAPVPQQSVGEHWGWTGPAPGVLSPPRAERRGLAGVPWCRSEEPRRDPPVCCARVLHPLCTGQVQLFYMESHQNVSFHCGWHNVVSLSSPWDLGFNTRVTPSV